KRIEAALPEARAELVSQTLEFFNVDTSRLTRQKQFDIAMEQIKARIERFKITAAVVIVLALIGAGLSAYAIAEEKKAQENTKSNMPDDAESSGKRPDEG